MSETQKQAYIPDMTVGGPSPQKSWIQPIWTFWVLERWGYKANGKHPLDFKEEIGEMNVPHGKT